MAQCKTPNCDNKASYVRDLCRGCYQQAAKMVRDKVTTWDELMAMGLAGPASARGRPHGARHRFTQAFQKAKGIREGEATDGN